MPLTTGVDTYATEAELTAYATARAITLAGAPEVLLIKAMDYLDTLEDRWQGERTDPLQPLAWPRAGVFVRGVEVPDDAIPDAVVKAQIMLAVQADKMDLLPVIGANQSGAVTGKSVGDVSVSYAEGSKNQAPLFPAVATLLGPYFRLGGGMNFNVRRI